MLKENIIEGTKGVYNLLKNYEIPIIFVQK